MCISMMSGGPFVRPFIIGPRWGILTRKLLKISRILPRETEDTQGLHNDSRQLCDYLSGIELQVS